jgi:hypothetical protein
MQHCFMSCVEWQPLTRSLERTGVATAMRHYETRRTLRNSRTLVDKYSGRFFHQSIGPWFISELPTILQVTARFGIVSIVTVSHHQWAPQHLPAVLVGITDRWEAPGEDRLDHAGAYEMGVQLPPSSMKSREIADEFFEWSTKAANDQLAASLPMYLFTRFTP